MGLMLAVGAESEQFLGATEFREWYQSIYDQCPWATAFQHFDFVAVWYQTYRDQYTPVLALDYEGNRLVGVFTLALAANGELVAAGAHQAEYQCWLCKPEHSAPFAAESFSLLRDNFPGKKLELRYLPPQLSIADLPSRLLAVEARERPFILTSVPVLKTKNRNKINALNRLGTLRFEELANPDDYRRYKNTIEAQYNVRQAFANASYGFLADPHKSLFHERLFEKGLLHASLLRLDDTLLAANLGMRGRDQVHMGVFSSHVFSAYRKRSPGILHVLLLAEHLREQGIPMLDLTPCGNYKEEVANGHDTVHALTIYPNRRTQIAAQMTAKVRAATKTVLAKSGVSPALAQNWMRSRVVRSSAPCNGEDRFYGMMLEPRSQPLAVVPDPLADFARYRPGGRQAISRAEFLAAAVQQIERGAKAFTRVEHERLTAWAFAWLSGQGEPDPACAELPPGSAVVRGLGFCKRTPLPAQRQFIIDIREALAGQGVYHLWFAVAAQREKHLLETCGFQPATGLGKAVEAPGLM